MIGQRFYAYFARRIHDRWTRPETADGMTAAELWEWVERHASDRGRLWVVSPRASDMLTLSEFWPFVDEKRFRIFIPAAENLDYAEAGSHKLKPYVGKLIFGEKVDIVSCRSGRRSIVFCSWGNYFGSPIEQAAKWVGVKIATADPEHCGSTPPPLEPYQTREIIARSMRKMIDRWVAEDCGSWRETAGQLVVSLWRRRFMSVKVCRHADELAASYEAEALHGGRASVWYYGDVGTRAGMPKAPYNPPPKSPFGRLPGMAHRWDISSMYPTLLRDCIFPVRLTRVLQNVSLDTLRSLSEHYAVIACVNARLTIPEYPVQHGGRSYFPRGEGRVVLAGPELRRLIAEDGVISCAAALVYDAGRPFAELAAYLMSERARMKADGDTFGEQLMKAWANKFGGKFAQRGTRWEPCPTVIPPVQWGQWRELGEGPGQSLVYRCVAGLPFRQVEGQRGAGLLAGVYAYLTSYGRDTMRTVRARMPSGSVLAQDTDGLWLDDEGNAAMAAAAENTCVGSCQFRHVESVTFARFYTPKHYYAGGKWTLAGVPSGWVAIDNDSVRQTTTSNPIRHMPDFAPVSLTEVSSSVRLSKIARPDYCTADGWAIPFDYRKGRIFPPSIPERRRRLF